MFIYETIQTKDLAIIALNILLLFGSTQGAKKLKDWKSQRAKKKKKLMQCSFELSKVLSITAGGKLNRGLHETQKEKVGKTHFT